MSIALNIEDMGLRPIGEDTGGTPESVLFGQLQIGNGSFHVAAFEVTEKGGELFAVNEQWQDDLNHVYGLSGTSLTHVAIDGRQYVLTVYPFAA